MNRRNALTLAALHLLCLPLFSLTACDQQPTPPQTRLHVLAAASLADAFREMGTAYETTHENVKVEFNFGGSNHLRALLQSGGPGDVFVSADRAQMNAAIAAKVIDSSTISVFAHNQLAIIVPKPNRAHISSLSDLVHTGHKIIVADNAVPAGNYTRQMFNAAAQDPTFGPELVARIEANIISREENVAAVVAKVALNEADAGFAYASDAFGGNAPKLTVITLPPGLTQRTDYLAAVTSRTANHAASASFVSFLNTPEARTILLNRGFTGPDTVSP